MERFEPEDSAAVAPLRRKSGGSFTPKIPWLLYDENVLDPLRRKLTKADYVDRAIMESYNGE
jgi:hypothetical protein